jgi:hypothetical protein
VPAIISCTLIVSFDRPSIVTHPSACGMLCGGIGAEDGTCATGSAAVDELRGVKDHQRRFGRREEVE